MTMGTLNYALAILLNQSFSVIEIASRLIMMTMIFKILCKLLVSAFTEPTSVYNEHNNDISGAWEKHL